MIAGVTAVATLSVIRGIHGGVRILSNANMIMAGLLLLFVIFAGPTLAVFQWLWDTSVSYASNMFSLSNPFGREEDTTWFHGWTVFYWAWWISWSPFVGMFIARVSHGRTVREFVTAVLIIPTIITLFWMSAFGGGVLLFVGGEQALNALQAGALSVGLPFTLVLLVMTYSLFKGLHHERRLLIAEGKMV